MDMGMNNSKRRGVLPFSLNPSHFTATLGNPQIHFCGMKRKEPRSE